jgi:hypothetical protein
LGQGDKVKVNTKKLEEIALDKKVADLIHRFKGEEPHHIKYLLMVDLKLSSKQVDASVLRLYRGF